MGKAAARHRRAEEERDSAPAAVAPAHRPLPLRVTPTPATRESRLLLPERDSAVQPPSSPNPATPAPQRHLHGDAVPPRDPPAAQEPAGSSLARRLVSPRRNGAIPEPIRDGIAALSGVDVSDVGVHTASPRPARIGALAYTDRDEIHLAAGQEQHLAHEAWHVVQQRQGRVRPTLRAYGVAINNDERLEREADVMGARAAAAGAAAPAALQEQPAPAGAAAAPLVQRVERRVKAGGAVSSTWKFLRKENGYDIYEDNQPSTDLNELAPTRDVTEEIDYDALSDAEESDNELDVDLGTAKKIYRVRNIRDAIKLREQILAKNPDDSYGARIGEGGTVFRLQGKGTQFFIQTVRPERLVQSDSTKASGAMPDRETGDPEATGNVASYEHFASELRGHTPAAIGAALKGRFFTKPSVPYPGTFSKRAKAKLDEMMAVLGIAEPFRTRYAMTLFTGVVGALINGESLKDVLYKGEGQLEAMHPGASSFKQVKVSGQLMEQNIGKGKNDPHPTQKNMNISDTDFNKGVKRTRELFEAGSGSDTYYDFLDTHMMPMFGKPSVASGTPKDITADVAKKTAYTWGDAVIRLKPTVTVTAGEEVIYYGKKYTVTKITPTGFVVLDEV